MRIREPAFRDSENVRDPARYACPLDEPDRPFLTPDGVVCWVATVILVGLTLALWRGWL
jgi:hypothetical protein